MAFSFRQARDYFSTQLSVAASITDTTMRAPLFTGLDSDYGEKYVPLVLHDDAAGVYEIVWVSAHASGSDTVTVARGKEGTTARAWPSGTRVECAPTRRDMIVDVTSGTLPADMHFGGEAERIDKLDTAVKTFNGWMPKVGVAFAADVGPNMVSVQPPDGMTLILRAQYVPPRTTDSQGKTTVNWKTPFPNNCLGAWATSVDANHIGPYVVNSNNATSCTIYVFHGSPTLKKQNNVSFMLFGIGW